jgi:hypothetical protein
MWEKFRSKFLKKLCPQLQKQNLKESTQKTAAAAAGKGTHVMLEELTPALSLFPAALTASDYALFAPLGCVLLTADGFMAFRLLISASNFPRQITV